MSNCRWFWTAVLLQLAGSLLLPARAQDDVYEEKVRKAQAQAREFIKKYDTVNPDEKISKDEWSKYSMDKTDELDHGEFNWADQDSNGTLEEGELSDYFLSKTDPKTRARLAKIHEGINRTDKKPAGGDKTGKEAKKEEEQKYKEAQKNMEKNARMRAEFEIKISDRDEDEELSEEEWIYDKKSFQKADENKDGRLDYAELYNHYLKLVRRKEK